MTERSRWFSIYLISGIVFAVATWLAVALSHGWSYMWYTGQDDPFWQLVEVPLWEQVLSSCVLGILAAAPVTGVGWLAARLFFPALRQQ